MNKKSMSQYRKETPVFSGVIRYFPDAINAVARCSKAGNDQHNPNTPLHWDRSKSGDEMDALTRHSMEVGTEDDDGIRHSTKTAWRALANLQKELEIAGEAPSSIFNNMTAEEAIALYLANAKPSLLEQSDYDEGLDIDSWFTGTTNYGESPKPHFDELEEAIEEYATPGLINNGIVDGIKVSDSDSNTK